MWDSLGVPCVHCGMTRERFQGNLPQLLERDRELAEVDACIERAAAEQGSFVVLEGRAGMGKSTLLAEARRRADRAGFAICTATANELESGFAYGVVRQLFEPAVGGVTNEERARLLEGAATLAEPVLDIGGGAEAGGEFPIMHGLYWLAANLSARTPLLLSVDDAHWADAASLRWLAYLLNRLDGIPVLVTMATRAPHGGPQGEVLAVVLANTRVRILPIAPLGESSVAALVRTTLGTEPEPVFTAACLRATAGNPLGLNELLRELRAGGVGPTSTAAPDLERRAPDAIARRVLRDLSLLGHEAERFARALAVIGDGTDLPLVARLADLEVDRAAEVADALQTADLIAFEQPPRFAHPLLRASVYDRLPAGARQKLHRRAARIVGSAGGEPEAVAAHLLRCQADGSLATVDWLRAAAPLAQRRGAPEAAISYLRRGLEEIDVEETGTRSAVLAELGAVEVKIGDPAAVLHLREALAGTTDNRARSAIMSNLAVAAELQSDEGACLDLLRAAIDELRGRDPDASTRLECILTELSRTDPRLGPSIHSSYPRLRELAQGVTPNAELARVTLAYLLSWRDGNREETLTLIGTDFGRKLLYSGRDLDGFGVIWSMGTLLAVDELHRAAGWCETVVREAVSHGHYPSLVPLAMFNKAYAEGRMGLLAEAEADAMGALEISQQHFPFWVPQAGARLGEILFERGKRQAAYDVLESLVIGPGVLRGTAEAEVREVRGRLRCARGWQQQGVADLEEAGRLCETLWQRNPIIWPWRATLAPVLAADCPDEARQMAQQYLNDARRSGFPRAIGIALRTLAGLGCDDSVELLRAAIQTLKAAPAPLDLARAFADLGSVLRRQGHRVEAREPLREALEIAARCGAVPLMEWVQEEALAAGARPRRPRLRGVDALTPSELRVARLAAEGRSNKEVAQALFITAKTVADHLHSTYSKLDITSREQLTSALGLSSI